jgi:hypothetical protein
VKRLTAAQFATERGVSESQVRNLITAHGIEVAGREKGRNGRNLYPADKLRAIPEPSRGQRSDLIGERIGRMVAAARTIAETRGAGAVDEHSKLESRILDGNPAAVRALLEASRRWAKRRPAKAAAALAEVEELAGQLADLPTFLSLAVRERIIRADAKARTTAPQAEENQP